MKSLIATYDELKLPYTRFFTPEDLAKKCVDACVSALRVRAKCCVSPCVCVCGV